MTGLSMAPQALVPVAIGALVAWRVVRRVRRLIGRQPVRPGRLAFTLVLFPLLVVLLGLGAMRDPGLLAGLGAGLAVGGIIGVLALRLTRYEITPQGLFYTPHTGIGIALSLLFVGRVLYRFGSLYLTTGTIDPSALRSFGSSALTLAVFGVLAGYYVAYAVGILSWRRTATRGLPSGEAPPAAG